MTVAAGEGRELVFCGVGAGSFSIVSGELLKEELEGTEEEGSEDEEDEIFWIFESED